MLFTATLYVVSYSDSELLSFKTKQVTNAIQVSLKEAQRRSKNSRKLMMRLVYDIRRILSRLILFVNMHLAKMFTSPSSENPKAVERAQKKAHNLGSSGSSGNSVVESEGDDPHHFSILKSIKPCPETKKNESQKANLILFFSRKLASWKEEEEKLRAKKAQNLMVVCDLCEQEMEEKYIEEHFQICKRLFKNQMALNEVNGELELSFEKIKRLSHSNHVLIKIQK